MTEERATIRIDRWLWFARFFKTRGIVTKLVQRGHVRVNSVRISKPAHTVGVGDTLTFRQETDIRVVKIIATGTRRGPAPEAQALYQDLTPERPARVQAPKFDGKGRPTKKDRRDLMNSRRDMLE